jgi:PAS domain S-box-containing protein
VRALLEASPDAVVVVSGTGTITGWSARATEVFGWTASEAIGQSAIGLLLPGQIRAYATRRLAEESGGAHRVERTGQEEYPLLRRDGSEFAGRVTWATLDAADGPSVVGFVHDLTEERKTEAALREGERRMRQVIDLVPHFIFAKDQKGRFILVNRAVAQAYGTTVEGLLGKADADFAKSPEEVEHFRRDDLEVIRGGCPKVIPEEVLTDASGAVRVLETIKIPYTISDTGETAVLGVATDITERRRVEAELLHAQKMEGIGRLAGGIAHDFNNLLTAILGYVQLLEAEMAPNSPLRADTHSIREAAERATALTRQLLTFARRDQAQPRPVDLSRLLLDMDRLLRRVLGADVELVTLPAPDLGPVEVDPGQMEQVLVNLAVNSRDAMPDGGRLVVATREVPDSELPPEAAGLGGAQPWVEISVADTGTGMKPEVLEHIFEPFFTTKAPGTGTGLGLAICYGIVRRHGGHIWAESALGKGTTVHILLPRTGAGRPTEPPEESPADPGRGHETLLVVDDEDGVRDVMVRTLEAKGYKVLSSGTAPGAVALADRHEGTIHLLVADVVMPAMSGPEVAERFLAKRPASRVLFVSGFHDSGHVRRGMAPAAGDLLTKPFTPVALARKVREVLDRDPAPRSAR